MLVRTHTSMNAHGNTEVVQAVYTLRDVAAGEQLSFDYLWASAENPQCVADLRATALALYNSVRAHWAVGFECSS